MGRFVDVVAVRQALLDAPQTERHRGREQRYEPHSVEIQTLADCEPAQSLATTAGHRRERSPSRT